jgi:hypothetical protein
MRRSTLTASRNSNAAGFLSHDEVSA